MTSHIFPRVFKYNGVVKSLFRDANVLVTGGTGMIGRCLVESLVSLGAKVRIASLDDPSRAHPGAVFRRADLTRIEECLEACAGMEFVFHLAGIKGSPLMTAKKPASFFVPTILFNTNMMEAARRSGVRRYLYTSTVGVYAPAEIFREDDVWKTFPSDNDKFAGWAKRMGELQAEAYRIEHGWNGVSIVRPANVYGRYDNFDPANAMVIPSLIRRALDGEDPFVVWGDGSPVRDFIHASDVAAGMQFVVEKCFLQPVNLGKRGRSKRQTRRGNHRRPAQEEAASRLGRRKARGRPHPPDGHLPCAFAGLGAQGRHRRRHPRRDGLVRVEPGRRRQAL